MVIRRNILTPREAAKVMGISYPTIKRHILDGLLRTTKTPGGHHRIAPEDINAYFARQRGEVDAATVIHETIPQITGVNQLRGEVASIRLVDVLAEVVLVIGDWRVTATVPADAVSEMDLKVGDHVTVLVRHADVMLGRFQSSPL